MEKRFKKRLAELSRRPHVRSVLIVGLCLAAILVSGLALALHPQAGRQDGGAEQRSQIITPRPFAATLSVAGTIVPGDDIMVIAPFDGVVAKLGFAYGEPVAEGQVLAEFDTREVRQRRNEAKVAYLKALQTSTGLAAWATGPEVARASRAKSAAAFDLNDTQRRMEETKSLLDKGLVARSEYDSLVQQERNQQMALAAAAQDLDATLKRGAGLNRQMASLELETARARLAELDAQLAKAVVRAPRAGVIVSPPADKVSGPEFVHAGARLSAGQLIGAIARSGGLAVSFQLSETDAGRIHPGQPVSVTGPGFAGFTARGHVTSVGAEALPAVAARGPMASFAATARLDNLTPTEAQVVRIGMTANLTIEIYRNPSALTVSPAAIEGAEPMASVLVRPPGAHEMRVTPVRLGHATPDAVEVLSGLKPGDVVVWTLPPSTNGG